MKLALIPTFPIETDLMWAFNQIGFCVSASRHERGPEDILSEFLDFEVHAR